MKVKEWKYGFAINEKGQPLYYDFNKDVKELPAVNYFLKTKKEISSIKGNLIPGASVQIFNKDIRIDNAPKDKPALSAGHQNIRYKVENSSGYVSSDGEKWEKLEIKYFKDTGKKNKYGEPLVLVYFECSFFKGEYELEFQP